VGLIHHPVVDKNDQTIAAAVTNLDLHDIARAARTYGVSRFYVVTPLEDQQELVRSIVNHWVSGAGATYNPDRRAALEIIELQPNLTDVLAAIEKSECQKPLTVVTSARMERSDLNYEGLRELGARGDRPLLMLFGTAWGLAADVIEAADYRLAPIEGWGSYNHLSVRSAVSIILDRLRGNMST
jgi:hypothetical protein